MTFVTNPDGILTVDPASQLQLHPTNTRTYFERLDMMVIAGAWTLLWCATFCVGEFEIYSHWLHTTEDDAYVNYKTENLSSWWDAANTVCTRSGGHLFVPRKPSSLDDLTNLLDENKVYWVGGLQYSSLIWTENASRYYKRLGSTRDVYGRHVPPSTIDDNSPFTCNVRCGNNSGLFGLKGRYCYCLGHRSAQRVLRLKFENVSNTEIRCPGDYGELCGDDKRISVYAGGAFYHTDMTSISSTGTCGYIRKIYGDTRKLHLHLDDDCTRQRFYTYKKSKGETRVFSRLRCHGDVCVSSKKESWLEADRKTRGLLEVTDTNREALYHAMDNGDFWIGLRRLQQYKWINGNNLAWNISRYHLDKRCLAVRRNASHVHATWYPCSDTHRAACQSIMLDKTEGDRGINLGVAASVVAVLMVCFIIAAIHFKRKGLYCFKANDDTDSVHSVNSPNQLHCSRATVPRLSGQTSSTNTTANHMLVSDAEPCDEDGVYSEIDSPEGHESSDPYTGPYLRIRAADSEDGVYNTTRRGQQVRRDDSTCNHIRTEYDLESSDQDGNVYHELLKV